jgi:hypothetical protein
MKATLEYDLPDEQQEFQDAVNGIRWKAAMWELDQRLRAIQKHAPDSMDDKEYKTYCKVREMLHECTGENGINFDL